MASLYTSDVYLIFKSHDSQEDVDIIVTEKDKAILRELGKK